MNLRLKGSKTGDRYLTHVSYLTILLAFFFIVGVLVVPIAREIKGMQYEDRIGRHIDNGFSSVSAPQSAEELDQAIKIIEAEGLDKGCIRVFFCSQSGDLNFWHDTLVAARDDARRASYDRAVMPEWDEGTLLTRHKEVLKSNYGGDYHPDRIHLYPNVAFWTPLTIFTTIMFILSLITTGVSFAVRGFSLDCYSSNEYTIVIDGVKYLVEPRMFFNEVLKVMSLEEIKTENDRRRKEATEFCVSCQKDQGRKSVTCYYVLDGRAHPVDDVFPDREKR